VPLPAPQHQLLLPPPPPQHQQQQQQLDHLLAHDLPLLSSELVHPAKRPRQRYCSSDEYSDGSDSDASLSSLSSRGSSHGRGSLCVSPELGSMAMALPQSVSPVLHAWPLPSGLEPKAAVPSPRIGLSSLHCGDSGGDSAAAAAAIDASKRHATMAKGIAANAAAASANANAIAACAEMLDLSEMLDELPEELSDDDGFISDDELAGIAAFVDDGDVAAADARAVMDFTTIFDALL